MVRHAKLLGPAGFSASASGEVAFFRADDAAVAGRKFLKTGEAIPLIEALIRLSPAGGAVDCILKAKLEAPSQQRI